MPKKAASTSKAAAASPGDAQPAAKRARNAPARVRGKQGALKVVMTLPLDLIWEICTHLDVGDLYHLSNTSKDFRAVVTGESSSGLFKVARRRSEMPELLSPMTDLQYAALFFGRGCKFCGNMKAGKPDPSLRVRICNACLKKEFVNDATFDGRATLNKVNRFTLQVVNGTVHHGRNGRSYHPADLKRVSDEIDAKFPHTAITRETGILTDYSGLLLELDLDDEEAGDGMSAETRKQMNDDWNYAMSISIANRPLDATEMPAPEGEFQTWLLERNAERRRRVKDEHALGAWMRAVEAKKSSANQQIRSGRLQDIERRLEAVGFEKTEFVSSNFLNHPQVKSTRPLSDRTYSTKTEPVLRALLENNRRKKIRDKLTKSWNEFSRMHIDAAYLPPDSIYLQLPALRPILDDVSRNPPNNLIIPAAVKAAALGAAENLVRDRRERLLRAIVVAHTELAKEEREKKQRQEGNDGTEEDEEQEEEEFSPTTFSSIDKLPLELPRLPPWIPRNENDPILATDEQLSTFLSSSPLARFECAQCRKLFSIKALFTHCSNRFSCQFYDKSRDDHRSVSVDLNEWMAIEGKDDVPRPLIRINKDVLSLSLKLGQIFDSTPLVLSDSTRKLPDLGPEYPMGEESPDWYKVSLECNCEYSTRNYSGVAVESFYFHLKERHADASLQKVQVKTVVDYSQDYRREWRRMQRLKEVETAQQQGTLGQYHDYEYGSSDEDMYGGYGYGYDYGGYGGLSDYDSVDEETGGGCSIM